MSDQWRPAAVISLEEIFRSQEFGRRPMRWDISPVATVEAADPLQLEQVFLSDLFGHPEAIAAPVASGLTRTNPPATRPTLVLLSGRVDTARAFTRYRGAIGAVSGVAAAALVVAGITAGTGSRPMQPTISAEGRPPAHGSAPQVSGPLPGPGGVTTQPGISVPSGQPPVLAAGAAPVAQLASFTEPTPVTGAGGEVSPPAPPAAPPAPPSPAPPAPPAPPSPGGRSVLTPVFVTVGTTVSTVGTTVTAASNGLARAVPAASPVTGFLANVGTAVTNLGLSVAGA